MKRFVLAFLLVACQGGPTPAPTGPTPAPSPIPTASPSPTPSRPPTISAECADALQPTMDALEELDARLDVGLNKSAYGDRVGDISVAYNRLNATELRQIGTDCLNTAQLLEDAFNSYIKASNDWGACLDRSGCTTDSIIDSLRADWKVAHDKIKQAREMFP